MQLVEKHIIKGSNPIFNEMDILAFKAKNLYNSALYLHRQRYNDGLPHLSGYDMIKQMQTHESYVTLPRKVSQQIILKLDKSYKSYFAALKAYKKDASKFKAIPKPPKYKDSAKGRFMVIYSKQAINKGNKLSGTNITVKTSKQNINEIRIIPNRDKTYTIEVVYTVADVPKKEDNGKIASIDLGLDNLMTLSSNAAKPIILNGKPLKSINQYYNKKKAYLQSKLRDNKKTSKRIQKLTSKRNNKINDYLHKATTLVINYLVSNDITTLIVGYNKEWKQRINIGSKNNQNFVGIPFLRVIQMLEYKCQLKGITLTKTEESYTSKTSFLDNEIPKKQESYLGRRVKRGLFKSASGKVINADLNGSLQIMKKVVPNAFSNGIEGFVVSPMVVTVK